MQLRHTQNFYYRAVMVCPQPSLFRSEAWSGDDGTIDYEYRYTYVGGKLTRQEHTYPIGGSTRLYTYAGDNLTSETSDRENDGMFDWRSDYTYDANGNITRTEWTKPTGETEIQTFIWEEQSIPTEFDIYIPAAGPLAFS
jgi:hypothetical protein